MGKREGLCIVWLFALSCIYDGIVAIWAYMNSPIFNAAYKQGFGIKISQLWLQNEATKSYKGRNQYQEFFKTAIAYLGVPECIYPKYIFVPNLRVF